MASFTLMRFMDNYYTSTLNIKALIKMGVLKGNDMDKGNARVTLIELHTIVRNTLYWSCDQSEWP